MIVLLNLVQEPRIFALFTRSKFPAITSIRKLYPENTIFLRQAPLQTKSHRLLKIHHHRCYKDAYLWIKDLLGIRKFHSSNCKNHRILFVSTLFSSLIVWPMARLRVVLRPSA
jgi:hypothetical protein